MPWDPDKYDQFRAERSAPFEDLLDLVPIREGLDVVDLGCGTGDLTSRLAEALPGSRVVGIDSSPEMLERTKKRERPGLRFAQGDIADVNGTWDLVFSNAAIQWVPDHATLLPRLLDLLRPGGRLAVQLPSNQGHYGHAAITALAAQSPFREALGGWQRRIPVLHVDDYAELLWANGGEAIVAFEKVYPHVLANADAMADWTLGTALVPYLERLSGDLRELFLERYRARLRGRFPGNPVFYGFRRILFASTKPA